MRKFDYAIYSAGPYTLQEQASKARNMLGSLKQLGFTDKYGGGCFKTLFLDPDYQKIPQDYGVRPVPILEQVVEDIMGASAPAMRLHSDRGAWRAQWFVTGNYSNGVDRVSLRLFEGPWWPSTAFKYAFADGNTKRAYFRAVLHWEARGNKRLDRRESFAFYRSLVALVDPKGQANTFY